MSSNTPPSEDRYPTIIVVCVVLFAILFVFLAAILFSDFLFRNATQVEVLEDFTPAAPFDPQEWLRGGANTPTLEAAPGTTP